MKNFLLKLFGEQPAANVYYKTITGEGFDEFKAFQHAHRKMQDWKTTSDIGGTAIKILETDTTCENIGHLSNCYLTVEYVVQCPV